MMNLIISLAFIIILFFLFTNDISYLPSLFYLLLYFLLCSELICILLTTVTL